MNRIQSSGTCMHGFGDSSVECSPNLHRYIPNATYALHGSHLCKPSASEVEAGRSGVRGHPLLHIRSEASLCVTIGAKSSLTSRFLMAALNTHCCPNSFLRTITHKY